MTWSHYELPGFCLPAILASIFTVLQICQFLLAARPLYRQDLVIYLNAIISLWIRSIHHNYKSACSSVFKVYVPYWLDYLAYTYIPACGIMSCTE